MQGQKTQISYKSECTCILTKADNKINAHIHKQKHRQVIETNKSPLQMLTYTSNARLWKKTQRQAIETYNAHYIVCSQKPITNAHTHKQCTVIKKTHRQAIETNKSQLQMLT